MRRMVPASPSSAQTGIRAGLDHGRQRYFSFSFTSPTGRSPRACPRPDRNLCGNPLPAALAGRSPASRRAVIRLADVRSVVKKSTFFLTTE